MPASNYPPPPVIACEHEGAPVEYFFITKYSPMN